ncbi:S-adenosyl-L-methionine-dependent methyltransferase [Cladochytrium replicatum]|nr:S-adenosyl-L-methionine-dependent methyltransferase [Cladochytrium replicatum]
MGGLCSKPSEQFPRASSEGPTIISAKINANAAAEWVGTTDTDGPANAARNDVRTFNTEKAPYVLPDDVREGSRLNMQHYLVREEFRVNYLGVTKEDLLRGLSVLDIGCGTGIWLAEMNRDFPKGTYHGVDISATAWAETFNELSAGKINLTKANILEGLPFEDNTFDYVHQQLLVAGLPQAHWPNVIAEIRRVLKPGGVIDLVEVDGVFHHTTTPSKLQEDFSRVVTQSLLARGINIRIANDLASLVRADSGFDKINEVIKESPCGWGGELGELSKQNARLGFLGMKPFMSVALGVKPDDWEATVETVLEDHAKSKAYGRCVRVTGRKIVT